MKPKTLVTLALVGLGAYLILRSVRKIPSGQVIIGPPETSAMLPGTQSGTDLWNSQTLLPPGTILN